MQALYPTRPKNVPAGLTAPTKRFRLHAWLAVLALLAFITLYFTLTGWLGWTSYRLLREGMASGHLVLASFKAAPLVFLFAFLVRGLFAVKHMNNPAAIEVTEADQPDLFAFLHRIAADAGAPKVHRVFLSPDVNAGVFYDLSLINLLLPTKKNLEVGLGVVNTLTLGEMKAVFAHEFGHFAQKTMMVGRWVYTAEQVAGNIIASRGVFDKILHGISRIDIRIAWIGWIMRLLLWSVRAVLDTGFRIVVLSKRALSREMELQADLVAVSLTGSDALVHALHKLHGADDAYGRAVGFAMNQVKKGRVVDDLFAIQTRMLESVRRISGDASYGMAPAMPERDRAAHRVFPDRFAQPPKMWSTHPPNREREDNAKRHYIPAPFDDRPSWVLISDAARMRREVTSRLLGVLNGEQPLPAETLPVAQVLDEVDASFGKTYLDTRYKGLYLGRGVTRHAARVDELFEETDAFEPSERLGSLYPPGLVDEIEGWLDLDQEHATLVALKEGFLSAPGGLVRYRGDEIRRRDLGKVIESVEQERDGALQKVLDRDRACRSAHHAAARAIGNGWDAYHRSLVALLHYAEHTEADLRDVDGHLQNVFAVVIADGRVSGAERRRLVGASSDAYDTLARIFAHKHEVSLPDAVARRLEVTSWSAALGDFQLGVPSEANIGDWLKAADSWLLTVAADLGALRACTLEVLLDCEEHIARCRKGACEVGEAPPTAMVPSYYVTVIPGRERERQKKLDLWDRFQVAEGLGPAAMRLAAAAAILGGAFYIGHFDDHIERDEYADRRYDDDAYGEYQYGQRGLGGAGTYAGAGIADLGGGTGLSIAGARSNAGAMVDMLDFRRATSGAEDAVARQRACAGARPVATAPGDAQYIEVLCTLSPPSRLEATITGFRMYVGHPLFAYDAGIFLAADGRFEEAKTALELVHLIRPDLRGEVSMHLARVRRAAAGNDDVEVHDLTESSTQLQFMEALESTEIADGFGVSYRHLKNGQLAAAVDAAYAQDPSFLGPVTLRLAAASDGAPPELVARALDLPPSVGINQTTVWSALALGLREERDVGALVDRAASLVGTERATNLVGWGDPVQLNERREHLEGRLAYLDPELRGHARVMGVVVLGEEAPDTWRTEAHTLLFAAERPYLRPPR